MAPDKSLAAEIEAKEPGQIAYEARFEGCPLGPRGVSDAWRDLPSMTKAIWARVEERVSAAIQSRAFEDGARWMRERAVEAAETVWEWIPQECVAEPVEAIAEEIRNLPLQPDEAQPTPTTEDKGREDRG